MRISYSKYTAFVKNPERFRLYYMLGLTPEGDDTPTNMNLGRRRGKCFHAIYEGTPEADLIKEYGRDLFNRANGMRAVVPDLGPMDWVEREFEVPILDGKHSINGRMDHRLKSTGGLGDFKTTKGTRTKKEVIEYFGELETSSQHHFYLKAAASFGEPTNQFTYHVVFDRKDKDHKPTYVPLVLPPEYNGPASIERTMSEVYAACEAIEAMTAYGIEKPWMHSNTWPCCGDRAFCGYAGICGRTIPKGCVPEGFTSRYKEQIQSEEGAL